MAKKKEAAPVASTGEVQQLLAGLQNLSVATQRPTLGPSSEYYTEQAAIGTPGAQGFAAFVEDDQWEPGSRSPAERARLQAMMKAAGLYGSGGYRAGAWTREDAAAYKQALEFANGSFIPDPEEAIRQLGTMELTEGTSARAPRAPLVVQYANPEAVRQVMRKSSMALLGRRLSDEEEGRMVAGYQAQVAASQQAAYAADETGGSVTSPMDADTYLESRMGQTTEAGTQRYLEAFDMIHRTLTGSVTEGPTLGQGGAVKYS